MLELHLAMTGTCRIEAHVTVCVCLCHRSRHLQVVWEVSAKEKVQSVLFNSAAQDRESQWSHWERMS